MPSSLPCQALNHPRNSSGQGSFLTPPGLVVKDNTLGSKLEIHLPPCESTALAARGCTPRSRAKGWGRQLSQCQLLVLTAGSRGAAGVIMLWVANSPLSWAAPTIRCIHYNANWQQIIHTSSRNDDTQRSIPVHTALNAHRPRGDRPADLTPQSLLPLLLDLTDNHGFAMITHTDEICR